MNDGTYTGVIDRIVDGEQAVILVEDEGETIDERVLHVNDLPADAQEEGMVVEVDFEDGEATAISARPEEMQDRLERNRKRLDSLSRELDNKRDG